MFSRSNLAGGKKLLCGNRAIFITRGQRSIVLRAKQLFAPKSLPFYITKYQYPKTYHEPHWVLIQTNYTIKIFMRQFWKYEHWIFYNIKQLL